MKKRILIALAILLLVPWLGSALLFSLLSGVSVGSLLSGLRLGPAILAAYGSERLRGEAIFANLDHPQAAAVLREAFGQGVSPSDGRMLYDLIVANGYRRVLDIGTARGYGAIWFGLAAKKTGGKVTTIEIDPAVAAEACENFRRAGLADVIDSRINDGLLEVPALPGEFDFVFMDTGAPLNKQFLDLLAGRITPGGTIAAHNAFGFQATQPDFLKAITTDPGLETRIVTTFSGGISITVMRFRGAGLRPATAAFLPPAFHSYRKAVIGLTLVARRAGR